MIRRHLSYTAFSTTLTDMITSDAAVDEGIIANEYSFTAAGRRFG